MKIALLIILFAHGGYWFAGQNTVTLNWREPAAGTPASVLEWKLSYGMLQIAAGELDVAAGANQTSLKLQVPEVRAHTTLQWTYELHEKQTGKLLERGTREIHLVPPRLLEHAAPRMKNSKIVLVDQPDGGLATTLQAAGIDAHRVSAVGDLQLLQADIILVAEDQLPDNPAAQEVLLTRARQGAGIMILAQHHASRIGEWDIRARKQQTALTWRESHPLFDCFPPATLDAWANETDADAKVLALPADAPLLELGYFPRETPGNTPVPIDALAATQTLGLGRIVFWQLPIDSWKEDPRGQLLLANALDYLQTRPEPTLPQSQRKTETPATSVPRQLIGAQP
jgi:hypothetical protein